MTHHAPACYFKTYTALSRRELSHTWWRQSLHGLQRSGWNSFTQLTDKHDITHRVTHGWCFGYVPLVRGPNPKGLTLTLTWWLILAIRIDWRSRISDLTSHFKDGGYDVISRGKLLPPGSEHEASAGRLCSSVSSPWSIAHSYLFCYEIHVVGRPS